MKAWALGTLPCLLLLNLLSGSGASPHYAVLIPAEIHFPHTERACVHLTGLNGTAHVTVKLHLQEVNLTLLDEEVEPSTYFKCVSFQVPLPAGGSEEVGQVGISVESEGHTLENKKKVLLRTVKSGTFVQTDKAVYKPGQTVKFRIVTLNEDFIAENKPYSLVQIQDPNSNRISQWLEVVPKHGIVDLSIPLSSEPPQGTYVISVGDAATHRFQVEEYVLPRFEVLIELPKVVSIVDEYLKMQLCARYTYGKPVQGRFSATVCRKPFYYHWSSSQRPPDLCMTMTGKLERSGCFSKKVELDFFNMTERSYTMTFDVEGSVTEDDTDVTLSGSRSCTISSDIATVTFEGTDDYYKKGIPYTGLMKLASADGTPMKGQTVYLFSEWGMQRLNQSYETDDSGRVFFSLNTSDWTSSVNLRGSFKLEQQPWEYGKVVPHYQDAYMWLKPFYSKSKSFLKIHSAQGQLPCGHSQDLQVDYIIQRNELHEHAEHMDLFYLVSSKGGIIHEGNKKLAVGKEHVLKGTFVIELPISTEFAPLAKVLVFTIFEDGEVAAATTNLNVVKCFKNEVTLGFSQEEALPGADISLHLHSAAGSLCAVRAVDKSTVLMKPEEELTSEKVFNMIRPGFFGGYPYQTEDPMESPCPHYPFFPGIMPRPADLGRQLSSRRRRSIMPWWPQRDPDVYSLVQAMGIKMITNANIRQPVKCPEHPMYMHRHVGLAGPPGGAGGVGFRLDNSGPMVYASMPDSSVPQANVLPESQPKVEEQVRKHFPETWIWDLTAVGESGTATVPVTVPDTITDWVAGTFCVADIGFGMSSPVTLRAFKPFFAELSLPYSVVRDETFTLKASVFNYMKESIKIQIHLLKSEEFKVEAHPKSEYTSCLGPSEGKTFSWSVTAMKLGEVNLTVTTEALDSKDGCGNDITVTPTEGRIDTIIKPILVKPGGVLQEKAHSSLLCAQGDGEVSEVVSLQLPENILKDSERAHISALGDIMGTALQNIDKLLTMPYGCGEQNMVKFAPNIYIMQYLTRTNQMTPEIKEKAEEYLKSGYQRQLNYKHDDGSYSAFGKSDQEGNTWLTAFVMKSFGQAQDYIYIDKVYIQQALSHLKEHQVESGGFNSSGKLLNNALKGGVEDNLSLSAYITAAMLELGMNDTDSTVKRALAYLEESLPTVTNTYTLALMAYTFTLADYKEARDKVIAVLNEQAVKSEGQIHWERKDKPKEDNVPYWYQAPSAEVEMTSYVLLAYMSQSHVSKEDLGTASQIVSWLSKQQNPYGGFSSTQDTVVALMALARYAGATYSEKGDVTVTVKCGGEIQQQFHVDNKNRLLMQQAPLAKVPGEYTISAAGKGCVYVQTTLRYNIPPPKSDATFKLAVRTDPESCTEAAKSKFGVTVTASYIGTRETSNMALIVVDMVSGFIPVKSSVRELKDKKDVKKVEITPDQVTIYLDQLDKTPHQFSFSLEQDNEVKDMKPATVMVYDYYEKGDNAVTEYSAPCSAGESTSKTAE
ncbi:alpha-2-macroglobulin-like protein 1 isoform X2 [Lissotriton helveticus]